MQAYPGITQTDAAQQMLGQAMGGYKPNQLGAGVTLGNPEAQQDYIAQLAQALADGEFSAKQIEQAGSMLTPEFIQNSGLAGVADMVLKTYVGKKMDEKGRTLQADAEARRMAAQEGVDDRRAMKEADRTERVTTRERTRRQSLAAQMGLNNREAVEFIETGKVPQAVRGVPMMTNQGLVNVDPYTGEYETVQPQGQQRSQPQTPFQIEGDVPPEVRAAMQADPAAWESGQQIDIPPPKQPLMPYVDPAVAQQRDASNRRADEAAARADRADKRADRDLQFRQEQARKKAEAQDTQPNAMRQDAINFAAAYIGKSPEDVAKMTPEQVREAVASGGRWMAGPVMGRIPGASATFNADLDAYSSSAAAKLARINNPAGVVTNADFQAAEKGVFSATKPAEVNADLIYQALQGGKPAAAPQGDGGLTPEEQRELEDLRKRLGR